MHKFIASLLLVLAAAALLSPPEAASSRTAPEPAQLITRVVTAPDFVDERRFMAKAGDYFDLQLNDGLLLSVRLTALDASTATIDAIVARDGLTLSEPSVRLARNTPAGVELSEPPLTVQFEVR